MGSRFMINLFKSFAVMMKWTCHKHRFILFREIKWYEDEYRDGYRFKIICRRCNKVINTKFKLLNR